MLNYSASVKNNISQSEKLKSHRADTLCGYFWLTGEVTDCITMCADDMISTGINRDCSLIASLFKFTSPPCPLTGGSSVL